MTVLARQGEREMAESAVAPVRAVVWWDVRGVVATDSGEVRVVDDLDQRARLELHIDRTSGGAVTVVPRLAPISADGAALGASIALTPPNPSDSISGRWIEDGESGLVHVDADGRFSVTWRRAKPGADCESLLYAGTSLFREIGLPGGRCEAPRFMWDTKSD